MRIIKESKREQTMRVYGKWLVSRLPTTRAWLFLVFAALEDEMNGTISATSTPLL
jgi:hypothetical protein